MSSGPGRFSRLAAAARAGATKAAGAARAGATKAAGAVRAGATKAAGAAAAAKARMGAAAGAMRARMPPPSPLYPTSIVAILNTILLIGGFYYYFTTYNKFRRPTTIVNPFAPNNHLIIIGVFLMSILFTYNSLTFYLYDNAITTPALVFGILAAGFECYFIYLVWWLFTGAKADQEQDIKDANSEADLTAATTAAQKEKLCETACAGDRTTNAATITANCPEDGKCPN